MCELLGMSRRRRAQLSFSLEKLAAHMLWKPAAPPPPLQERHRVVSEFAADLRKLGSANFLYSDGDVTFDHGHRRIQSATGRIAPPGLCIWSCHCADPDDPLTAEAWRPLGEGELLTVSGGSVTSG